MVDYLVRSWLELRLRRTRRGRRRTSRGSGRTGPSSRDIIQSLLELDLARNKEAATDTVGHLGQRSGSHPLFGFNKITTDLDLVLNELECRMERNAAARGLKLQSKSQLSVN